MARVIAAVGPPAPWVPHESPFAALVRSITFQQLAGRAATAIHGRFIAALGGACTPERVMAMPEPEFRAVGLSTAKTASIRDLAAKVLDCTVPLGELDALSDDEIVTRLSTVRGIGRWTAEMFLMFQLGRPDVWPIGDLGVRKGYAVIHGLAVAPTPRVLMALGDPYRPYRSIAAWYCWRAVETVLPT